MQILRYICNCAALLDNIKSKKLNLCLKSAKFNVTVLNVIRCVEFKIPSNQTEFTLVHWLVVLQSFKLCICHYMNS